MIESHINAIEKVLLAQSHAAKNSGHPNLRGGPREWFIRDFLTAHLPSTLEIGQGEIIDINSIPNPPRGSYRPQVDVVIYRRDLPKISYSKTDFAYLSEGVMATIESKSEITNQELENANIAAVKHNSLIRSGSVMTVGKLHDRIFQYVVAYDGPANMSTVADWLISQIQTNGWTPNQMVDMIIILGKGVLWKISSFPELVISTATTSNFWAYIDQTDKNLLSLFIHMLTWAAASSTPPNTMGYVSKVGFRNIHVV
jgi:hypothetical protein